LWITDLICAQNGLGAVFENAQLLININLSNRGWQVQCLFEQLAHRGVAKNGKPFGIIRRFLGYEGRQVALGIKRDAHRLILFAGCNFKAARLKLADYNLGKGRLAGFQKFTRTETEGFGQRSCADVIVPIVSRKYVVSRSNWADWVKASNCLS